MVEVACKVCGKIFLARSSQYSYCSQVCRKRGIREGNAAYHRRKRREEKEMQQPQRKSAPTMSVHAVIVWIREYYEKTGVLLSYGKAVAKIEQEKGRANNG